MSDLQAGIDQLKKSIAGEVAMPGDPAYELSSTIFMAKGKPAVVVLPRTAEDVSKAIAFARNNKLILSVRNGGHSNAGHSTNNGGLVIDTQHFDVIEVIDEQKRLVRVGPGATWEMVAKALQSKGWAISSGDTSTVGVAGLALAGGIGWMVRRDGLTLDNMVAADIVTADGKLVHASSSEHTDLFWAIRGGGGNFGIAVSFEFTAHPAKEVHAGTVIYDLKNLRKVLVGWRDYMRTAPEELTTMFLVMPPNPVFTDMPAAVIIMICYIGDEAAATKAIEPLLNLDIVLNKDIKRKPYADVLEEAHALGSSIRVITHNAFVKTLSDELIDVICTGDPPMLQIRSLGGAMNRVAPDATAFAHRDNEVLIVSPSFVAPDATEATITEALAPWRRIESFSNGAYCNFFTEATDKVIAAAYPAATYERLARIKKQYNPENIFNQNYNIKPME